LHLSSWEVAHRGAAKCREILSLVLHCICIIGALLTIIPMAMVWRWSPHDQEMVMAASNWEHSRRRCPLYVSTEADASWGTESMAPCMFAAAMPVLFLVLSITLAIFHTFIIQTWGKSGEPPSIVFNREYCLIILGITTVEAVFAFAVAITVTDGIRETCHSYTLSESEHKPSSCKDGFHYREESARSLWFDTFGKLLMGFVGSWIVAFATTFIAVVYLARSRICSCGDT
ncbi:unnamed protein product, partial [Meganyctiphanes norvegica]